MTRVVILCALLAVGCSRVEQTERPVYDLQKALAKVELAKADLAEHQRLLDQFTDVTETMSRFGSDVDGGMGTSVKLLRQVQYDREMISIAEDEVRLITQMPSKMTDYDYAAAEVEMLKLKRQRPQSYINCFLPEGEDLKEMQGYIKELDAEIAKAKAELAKLAE